MTGTALQSVGEGFSSTTYTFPEGEALRFTEDITGLTSYFEVNADGLSVLKWQQDPIEQREWGTKPTDFGAKIYFWDQYMAGLFSYGKVDAAGKETQIGQFYRSENPEYKNVLVVPVEGEKRTDTKS
jgi:hypothetical protein